MNPIKMKRVSAGIVYEQIRPTSLNFGTSNSEKSKQTVDKLKSQKDFANSHPAEYKIAKTIYDAKGIVYDDEYKAVKAIKSIKDKPQFDIVQKILQWMTNGQGLATFLTSTNYLTGTLINVSSGTALQGLELTVKYLNSIISHLNKIKASKQTIDILTKKLDAVMKQWKLEFQAEKDNPLQPGALPGLAWDTWTKRAQQDPEFRHQYLFWMSTAASFFGPVGWFLSSGIMLGDAYLYWKEGKRAEAGISVLFAALPVVGKIVNRIPLIKQLGAKGMATLGEKIAAKKWSALNRIEIYVLERMLKLGPVLKQDLNEFFKARAKKALTKELARDLGGRPIISKIASGAYTASSLGAQWGLPYVPVYYGEKAWMNLYNKLGWKEEDIETQTDIAFNKMLNRKPSVYQDYLGSKSMLILNAGNVYDYDAESDKFIKKGTFPNNTTVKFIGLSPDNLYAQVKFKNTEMPLWVNTSNIKK
jgi:hypothetical protein